MTVSNIRGCILLNCVHHCVQLFAIHRYQLNAPQVCNMLLPQTQLAFFADGTAVAGRAGIGNGNGVPVHSAVCGLQRLLRALDALHDCINSLSSSVAE